MKRKLVAQGKYCLMSAIPKKWLDRQKLSKGDYIEFSEAENYLIVSAKPVSRKKTINITINNAERVGVIRVLHQIYDSGYKTVNIKFNNPKIAQHIEWIVNRLNNWVIKQLTSKTCTINTIEGDEEHFQTMFRRVFLQTKQYINLITKQISKIHNNKVNHTLKQKNISPKEDDKYEREILYSIILQTAMNLKRRINTSQLPLEYKYYYFIAIQFEEIADQYEFMFRALDNYKIKDVKNFIRMQKKLEKMIEGVYNNFYKFKLEWFLDFNRGRVWKEFVSEKDASVVYHIRAISERIKNIAKYTIGIKIQ